MVCPDHLGNGHHLGRGIKGGGCSPPRSGWSVRIIWAVAITFGEWEGLSPPSRSLAHPPLPTYIKCKSIPCPFATLASAIGLTAR